LRVFQQRLKKIYPLLRMPAKQGIQAFSGEWAFGVPGLV
jgi:hypothetical protein